MEKSKHEITSENLLSTCWLNGYSVASLARFLERSPSLVYRAVAHPDAYPNFYQRVCNALPLRRPAR